MKLDRNIKTDGRGKYGLIKNRRIAQLMANPAMKDVQLELSSAIKLLERLGIIDWGDKPETEFFAIRLKDKFACPALHEYAHGARIAGQVEYAEDVQALASRSGVYHPNCKVPD